jgi:hypothetical protein
VASATHFDIDDMAMAGYGYAAGKEEMPKLQCQLDIDAFNMGIRQYNDRHGASVSTVVEGVREVRHDKCSGRADKELAIICNH